MSDTSAPRAPLVRRIEIAVLTVLGVAATLLMFGNSIMRYIFGTSLVWAEEVIRLMFVWSMFIAVTTAFFRNEHIGFDNLAKKKGPPQFRLSRRVRGQPRRRRRHPRGLRLPL